MTHINQMKKMPDPSNKYGLHLRRAFAKLRCCLRDERGQSLLVQTLLVTPVLLLVIGLVYDLGAVALAQVRAQDAVDLAVQDAAKYISWGYFAVHQDLKLLHEAHTIAELRVQEYGGGHVRILELRVIPYERYEGLYLVGEVEVPMRYLRMIGIASVRRRVQALAVPAYGIESAGN